MAKDITIYTRDDCAYCPMVKEWLSNKGFAYTEVNVDQQPEKLSEMAQYTAAQSVPVVISTDAGDPNAMPKMMQGYNLARLMELVA